MALCTVAVVGKDGFIHADRFEAGSVFGAVERAMAAWSKLWWYSADAVYHVEAPNRDVMGTGHWKVRASAVLEWSRKRPRV